MTIDEIEKIVCEQLLITPESIHVNSRESSLVEARQIIMYFAIVYKCGSLGVVGKFFNRDHATTIHAKKTVENLCISDKHFARKITMLSRKIEFGDGKFSLCNIESEINEVLQRLSDLYDLRARIKREVSIL
jgi:chromosomal replication initiator protein